MIPNSITLTLIMRTKEKQAANETLAIEVYDQIAHDPSHMTHLAQALTNGEKITVGRRLLIAQAILNGITRRELEDTLGISPNTFTQVRRWLASEFKEYSPFVVTKHNTTSKRKPVARTTPFSLAHLRRNYPAHFLLLSIAEEVWQRTKKK